MENDIIVSLCKDIARHASQLEAESHGVEQSVDRYLELKNMLVNHYLYGKNSFKTIFDELFKSMKDVGGWDSEKYGAEPEKNPILCALNHTLCMFEYFLMLTEETKKI